MGTASLAEAPDQGRLVGFEKHQPRGNLAADALVQGRKAVQRGALADVDDDGRLADVGHGLGQFGEFRDQPDGQIVDRIIAQVLQRLERGAFTGPAQPGDDHQFGLGGRWAGGLGHPPLFYRFRHHRGGQVNPRSNRNARRGGAPARKRTPFRRRDTPRNPALLHLEHRLFKGHGFAALMMIHPKDVPRGRAPRRRELTDFRGGFRLFRHFPWASRPCGAPATCPGSSPPASPACPTLRKAR